MGILYHTLGILTPAVVLPTTETPDEFLLLRSQNTANNQQYLETVLNSWLRSTWKFYTIQAGGFCGIYRYTIIRLPPPNAPNFFSISVTKEGYKNQLPSLVRARALLWDRKHQHFLHAPRVGFPVWRKGNTTLPHSSRHSGLGEWPM